ncbi:MAG: hypothetical protein COB61_009680 [Thiotrichales bacterium]|nr:hypothetical protein [Thiotrichales bacterium]
MASIPGVLYFENNKIIPFIAATYGILVVISLQNWSWLEIVLNWRRSDEWY